MFFVNEQSKKNIIGSDRVNGWDNDLGEISTNWNFVRSLSFDPIYPLCLFWIETHVKETCKLRSYHCFESNWFGVFFFDIN